MGNSNVRYNQAVLEGDDAIQFHNPLDYPMTTTTSQTHPHGATTTTTTTPVQLVSVWCGGKFKKMWLGIWLFFLIILAVSLLILFFVGRYGRRQENLAVAPITSNTWSQLGQTEDENEIDHFYDIVTEPSQAENDIENDHGSKNETSFDEIHCKDVTSILEHVSYFETTKDQVLSFLTLSNSSAVFPILAGKRPTSLNHSAVLAGARFGNGRLVVGGHPVFLQSSPHTLGGNDQLLLNILHWLSNPDRNWENFQKNGRKKSQQRYKLGFYKPYGTVRLFLMYSGRFLTQEIEEVTFSSFTSLTKFDVICIPSTWSIYENPLYRLNIQKFVQEHGGGLFVTNTAWSWTAEEITVANRLVAPAGIFWEVQSAYAQSTSVGHDHRGLKGFNVSTKFLRNTHAGKLWSETQPCVRAEEQSEN